MSVMKAKEIMEVIPHRQPMLLIDTIEELTPGEHGIGKKCVSYNEPYFAGHFPQEPVMPGVLMIEALAQVGAVVMLSCPEYKGKTAYLNCTGRDEIARNDGKMGKGSRFNSKGKHAGGEIYGKYKQVCLLSCWICSGKIG